jgi:excisionase family DNA binding protein
MNEEGVGSRALSPSATAATDRTSESLAERWDCSAQHVRKMLADGRLKGLKLGHRMWRISAEEVVRVEAGDQSPISRPQSPASSGPTAWDINLAVRAARMIGKPKT